MLFNHKIPRCVNNPLRTDITFAVRKCLKIAIPAIRGATTALHEIRDMLTLELRIAVINTSEKPDHRIESVPIDVCVTNLVTAGADGDDLLQFYLIAF